MPAPGFGDKPDNGRRRAKMSESGRIRRSDGSVRNVETGQRPVIARRSRLMAYSRSDVLR